MDKKKKKKKKAEKDIKKDDKEEEEDKKEVKEEENAERTREKNVFEMQINELRRQLEGCDSQLQQQREELANARRRLETEMESEKACVSHFKRVLTFETERRLKAQEKLQNLKEHTEQLEEQVVGKFVDPDKSWEEEKSQFLQQKLELEGRLSLLEERRLKRNSQLAHLRKLEEALEDKTRMQREMIREEDMRQVGTLVKNIEQYLAECQQLSNQFREVFEDTMRVLLEAKLKENVRLRDMYFKETERLLQSQDQSRKLKILQKSIELEEEIQTSAEEDVRKQTFFQEKQLHRLLSARQELQSKDIRTPVQIFSEDELDVYKMQSGEQFHGGNYSLREVFITDDVIKQKTMVGDDTMEPDKKQNGVSPLNNALKHKTEITEQMPTPKDAVKYISEIEERIQGHDKILQKVPSAEATAEQNILEKISKSEATLRILKKGNIPERKSTPKSEVKYNIQPGERIVGKDNSLRKLFTSDCILEHIPVKNEQILEHDNILRSIDTDEYARKSKTKSSEVILKEDSSLRKMSTPENTDRQILNQDKNLQRTSTSGKSLEQDHSPQAISTFQDAVEHKRETDRRNIQQENNMKDVSGVTEIAMKKDTESVYQTPEQYNQQQKVFTAEDAVNDEAEKDERIFNYGTRFLEVITSITLKTQTDKQNVELDKTEQELWIPGISVLQETETDNQILKRGNKIENLSSSVESVKQKIESIAEDEAEYCRLLDKRSDVMAILKDQALYKERLERELELNTDQNGKLISAILRAGEIFEARYGKVNPQSQPVMDFDVLQQIQMLLDLASKDV